jgi:peptidyl-prolyl cis-trans isomerase C
MLVSAYTVLERPNFGQDGLAGRKVWRRKPPTWMRDPLLHFLLLGVLIFVVAAAWRQVHDPRTIVVDRATVEQVAADYRRRFGDSPTPEALQAAVSRYVGDEALYREGMARGLDRDDELVRRRIIQKMEFLQDDAAPAAQPAEADLRRYYADHIAQYTWPARASFRHIYFSTGHGEASARARAEDALARLAGGAPEARVGDAFFDRTSFTNLSQADAERVFGQSALPQALLTSPVGVWTGPVASGYGLHLLRVDQRTPAQTQSFESVSGQVASDFRRDAQEARSRKAVADVVARYHVVFATPVAKP